MFLILIRILDSKFQNSHVKIISKYWIDLLAFFMKKGDRQHSSKALRYWDYLALSETIWHLMVSRQKLRLGIWYHQFLTLSVLWYVTIWMLMSWTEINFLKLKMWPSVASSLTIILVILFFFMASQQLAGNILAFFHCLTPLSSTMCGVVSGFGIEGRIMKFKVWITKITLCH